MRSWSSHPLEWGGERCSLFVYLCSCSQHVAQSWNLASDWTDYSCCCWYLMTFWWLYWSWLSNGATPSLYPCIHVLTPVHLYTYTAGKSSHFNFVFISLNNISTQTIIKWVARFCRVFFFLSFSISILPSFELVSTYIKVKHKHLPALICLHTYICFKGIWMWIVIIDIIHHLINQ